MRGTFTISIDLELAWGIWDKPSATYFRLCAEKEERIVDGLLAMFERYDVPATWAVVGRLLERAERFPVETEHGDRIWYAPHLIEKVRASKSNQEVGSHSFEHVYFGQIDRARATDDIQGAKRVHDQHGLDFVSFVFPRNQVGHLDVLEQAGVRVFRSLDRGWFMDAAKWGGGVVGQAANLADKIVPVPPQVVEPLPSSAPGMVDLPSSTLLLARNGLRRLVTPLSVRVKNRLGLEAAKRQRKLFHLWFHPSNFYYETDRQLAVLESIVAGASRMRDRGQLEIAPMSSFAPAPSRAPRSAAS